jgi:hypothetical protein
MYWIMQPPLFRVRRYHSIFIQYLFKYIVDSCMARLFEFVCRLFIADIDIKCNDLKDIGADCGFFKKRNYYFTL